MSERIIRKYNKPKGSGEGTNYVNYNITIGGGGQNNYKYLNADQAKIGDLNADNINAMNIKTIYLMADDGTISKINGNELDYSSGHFGELRADNFHADKMDADYADIKHLVNDYMNSQHIDVKDLTVTGTAHFFQLIIDKINSVEGTQIISAAHCDIDYVEPIDSNGDIVTDENETPAAYRVYWKKSQDGKAIQNSWVENDQAIAMNFNEAQVGTNTNVSNTNYWRLVTDVCPNNERVWVNYNTGDKLYEQPDDKIKFNGFSWTRGAITDPETGETLDADSNVLWTVDGQANGIWDPAEVGEPGSEHVDTSGAGTMTANQTLLGIQIGVDNVNSPNNSNPKFVKYGTFSFTTYKSNDDPQVPDEPLSTKLNVGFYYDDDFVEYFPADEYKSEYSFELQHDADVEQIVISSAVVDEFNESWWITLGNAGNGGVDQEYMVNSTVPKAGDTIAQLGYRPTENDPLAFRSSAIIIAAYTTPDTGGNGINPIVPPSYAQYVGIETFELSAYRRTYFDATRFVIDNADIKNTVVDTIRIIPEQNPVTKDSNGNFNTGANGFDVSFLVNSSNQSTLQTTVPNGTYVKYTVNPSIPDPVTVTAGYHPVIPLTSNDLSISVNLYNSSNMIIDTLNVSIILLDNISNGRNGEYDQWAYRNAANNPGYPSENYDNNTHSYSTYPPTDWSQYPTTPTTGQHTWMITRHISMNSSNQPEYGGWSYPIQITGENGRKGEDGTDFEFIYFRTNNPTSVTNPNNISQGEISPTGVANGTETDKNQDDWVPNGWTDRPQGVESDYQYEYMSQRTSYDSNGTKMWNNFTTPALWSKWGENGLDGDGIKYIFTMVANGTLNAPVFSPNGWNDVWSNRFDSNNDPTNNGHMWYDDSFSPTDTVIIDQIGNTWSNSNVLCSISKTYTKDSNDAIWWTNWSTPKTWAMYVTDGTNGATGPAGPQGDDGEGHILSPIKRTWEVQLVQVTNQKYEALSSKVVMDLEYKIAHWKGDDQIEEVNLNNSSNFSVKAIVKDSSGTVLKNYTVTTNQWVKDTTSNSFKLDISDVLRNITGHGWSTYDYDYRKIISSNNSTSINALPVTLEIQLLDGQTVIDNDIRNLETEGKGLFVTTNSVLQSVYQGVGATDNNQYSNYFTNLQQTMKGFELSAAEAIIGANGAFTTFGSDHLPQTDTEKCFLTAYSSATNWPGNGSINIFDSATPTGAYNNNGTVCYDGSSYWNSSSNVPTLNTSNAYMWMVRGYRTSYLDSNNITRYTSWKVNTPILYGAYDTDGVIYNNAKLLIDARQIKSSVSTIASDYITSTELTQTSTEIKAEVTSDISGELKRTGIDIKSGSIELNADKTTITGDTLVLNQDTGLVFNGTEYPLYVHDGVLEHSGLDNITEDELGTIISLSKTGTTSGSSASITTDETNIAWVDANKSVKFNSIEVWIPEYNALTSNPTLTVQISKPGSSWSNIYSGSISKANEYNSISLSSYSTSSATAGIWKMRATLSSINGPSSTTVNVNVYCELIASKFSEIAGNGFNYILDSDTYFGSTGTSIVYDDKYMSLKTEDHKLKQKYIARDWNGNGVQDYDTGSLYGTIGTQLVPKILTAGGTIGLEAGTDVYLFDGGSSVTFTLDGGSARIGRVIYVSNVRSTSSVTHTITGSTTDPVQIIYNGQKTASISLPQYKTLCLICISEGSSAGNSINAHEWIAFGV